MKQYTLEIKVNISERTNSYESRPVLRINLDELLPANVDPQSYVRQRLAEEIKRQFGAMVEPIDNKTEEKKAEAKDELLSDPVF